MEPDVSGLIEWRDELVATLEKQQYEFRPANWLQVSELKWLEETIDRLTKASPNQGGVCNVGDHGAGRRGKTGRHQR